MLIQRAVYHHLVFCSAKISRRHFSLAHARRSPQARRAPHARRSPYARRPPHARRSPHARRPPHAPRTPAGARRVGLEFQGGLRPAGRRPPRGREQIAGPDHRVEVGLWIGVIAPPGVDFGRPLACDRQVAARPGIQAPPDEPPQGCEERGAIGERRAFVVRASCVGRWGASSVGRRRGLQPSLNPPGLVESPAGAPLIRCHGREPGAAYRSAQRMTVSVSVAPSRATAWRLSISWPLAAFSTVSQPPRVYLYSKGA